MYNVHMSSLYTKESVPFRESLQNVKVYLISYNIKVDICQFNYLPKFEYGTQRISIRVIITGL